MKKYASMTNGNFNMNKMSLFLARANAAILPILTLALAAGVFTLDTVTVSEVAASVLYVAVVLLSIRFCSPRGVVLVALACMALTVLSYFFTPALKQTGLFNTAISLLVVGLTTYLALAIESARTVTSALTEANQLRDALIGSVSHELRTPLASILGGVSILAETPAIANDQRLSSLAHGVREEALRLNNDIQNLLDAARISSKGLQSRRDWADPTDIVNAAVERIRARRPGRLIDLQFGSDLPLVHVDPVLVEQAIGQLIDNAAKYSAETSVIKIAVKAEAQRLIITIQDEGLGLADDEKPRLTERFFRGSRHIGKISGSGLGLWIASTFLASDEGTLEVSSAGAGQGTTVRVRLPASPRMDEKEGEPQEE
jgi:K+-sensing histidine kinase KdpD